MRGTLVATMLFFGLAGPAAAQVLEPGRDAVQPGMLVHVADTSCTGGFIHDGVGALAGRHYLGLAAHCVEKKIGAVATDAAGEPFGKVAFSAWPYDSYADDYAFIEIDPAAYPRVDPAPAGHPGVPTGVLKAGEATVGDRVQFSGWGFVTEQTATTREQRVSFLKNQTDRLWFAWGIVSNTDSGGAVFHVPSGKALGTVSNYCVPLPVDHAEGFEPGCTAWGPTTDGTQTAAAALGFTVEVRTADEGAPTVPPPPPPPPVTPAAAPASSPPPYAVPAAKKPATKRKACKRRKGESRKRHTRRCKRRR